MTRWQPVLHRGVGDAEQRGEPAQQEQHASQPARRVPQQGKRPPHPVERDVDADSGHDRPGRSGRGGVTARQPHLERHQAGLDREPAEQQHQRGGPGRAAGHTGERGQRDRVRFAGQEQQPGQQRGPADLAERERDLRRPRPARPAALEPGEQVERDGQRLPSEQHGERVGGRHEHRDRANRERVASAQAPAADCAGPCRPAGERDRDGHGGAERHDEEHPGQLVGGQPERLTAREGPGRAAGRCPGGPCSRRARPRRPRPGIRSRWHRAGTAAPLTRPRPGRGTPSRSAAAATASRISPAPNSQLTASPSRCCRAGPRRSAGH